MKFTAISTTLALLLLASSVQARNTTNAFIEDDTNNSTVGGTTNNIEARTVARMFAASGSIDCTVAEVHGLPPPGSPDVPKQYTCGGDNGEMLFFDGDVAPLLAGADFDPGHTRLSLTSAAMSPDGKISVQQAMSNHRAAIISNDHDRKNRRLTQTGEKKVLVVRVVGGSNGATISQSEARLYNDIFSDENNLAIRYKECSNNQLTFAPATGTYDGNSINNGVITVTVPNGVSMTGMTWQTCGSYATSEASSITRNFLMIVCPDVVDFGGAAAWGNMPGSNSWYKSQYASAPIVQVHEVGHNLGHPHSGEFSTYDDKTCNMGNQGFWSDTGSKFCFNGVKTWRNGWHSAYHSEINPQSYTYNGDLYGINAVNEGSISSGDKVVIKASTSSQSSDIYVMFHRQADPISQAPAFGNTVIVHRQDKSSWRNPSYIIAKLSAGQSHSYSWGSAGNLIVEVCSIDADANSSPGVARVLVYADGVNALTCDGQTATPVATPTSPVAAPTTSKPVATPTTSKPVATPTTSKPVATPTVDGGCQDNDKKWQSDWNASKMKNCNWASGRRTKTIQQREIQRAKRCAKGNTASECPVTCKTECTCYDSPGFFFKSKTCEKISSQARGCFNKRNRANCPIACKVC